MIITKYITIDIEENTAKKQGNGAPKCGRDSIIQLSATMVKVDEKGNIIDVQDKFDSYVYCENLYKKITKLTGIKREDILNAPKFIDVWQEFVKWAQFDKNTFIVTWGLQDKLFLNRELAYANLPNTRIPFIDLQHYIQLQGRIKRLPSLEEQVNKLIGNFEGVAHNALSDAINTSNILKLVLENSFQSISYLLFNKCFSIIFLS